MYLLIPKIIVLCKSLLSMYIPKMICSEFIYGQSLFQGVANLLRNTIIIKRPDNDVEHAQCHLGHLDIIYHMMGHLIFYIYVARCFWEESCELFILKNSSL